MMIDYQKLIQAVVPILAAKLDVVSSLEQIDPPFSLGIAEHCSKFKIITKAGGQNAFMWASTGLAMPD